MSSLPPVIAASTNLLQRPFFIHGVAGMVEFARQRGVGSASVLENTGIAEARLLDPEACITAAQEFRVIRNLQRALPDPMLGFHIGAHFRLGTLGVLGASVMHCANLGEALRFLFRHLDLSYTFFLVRQVLQPDGVRLQFLDQYPLGDLRLFYLQRDLMFGIRAIRDVLPEDWTRVIRGVDWAPVDGQVGDAEALTLQLGVPVVVQTEYPGLLLDPRALRLPLPQANALTLSLLEAQCEQMEARLLRAPSTATRVRQLLHRLGLDAGLEAIAAELHMTSRTLRRRLQAEDQRFADILEDMRRLQAERLLLNTRLPVSEIALAVGYSESAAFVNAFRRWTGLTPARFRQQAGGGRLPSSERLPKMP